MGKDDNDDPIDVPMETEFRDTEKRRFKEWLKDLWFDEFTFVEQAVKDENKRREKEAFREQQDEDEGDFRRGH